MSFPSVVVVGEQPDLGSAICDLLKAERFHVVHVRDLAAAERLVASAQAPAFPLLVLASNRPLSPGLRSWSRGALRELDLVLVGAREVSIPRSPRLHVVSLPLDPGEFLKLVRSMVDREPPAAS